ncbi:MAG: Cof-type HAD-IIB family hydrolase [Dehalococcoidales bacterium]|nr:Cof-type HAD-IIB family hydrolase [Dehalococcoidales bacterium]
MTKNHYKLLVVDIDGTLVGGNKIISPENRDALVEAHRTGVQVAISTGRSLSSCREILAQLPLDSGYHIFFDGALVTRADLSEEVYVQPLAPLLVKEMVEYARREKTDLELFSRTRYFTHGETWSAKAHREFFGIEAVIRSLDGLWDKERIIKAGLVTTNTQEEAQAEKLIKHFGEAVYVSRARTPVYPGVVFNNLLASGVSKGNALKKLAARLKIPLEAIIAIGDGSNDISQLSTVGLAIAMGNASHEVKSIAHHVTLDVDEHGLAAAIRKFLL